MSNVDFLFAHNIIKHWRHLKRKPNMYMMILKLRRMEISVDSLVTNTMGTSVALWIEGERSNGSERSHTNGSERIHTNGSEGSHTNGSEGSHTNGSEQSHTNGRERSKMKI